MSFGIFGFFRELGSWKLCATSMDKYWSVMCPTKLESMFSWGILFVVLLGIVMILLSYNKSARFVKSTLSSLSNHILVISLIVWVLGVWVYIVGLHDCNLHWLAVMPRAIIASFKMFVVAHDLARVNESMRSDTIYMMLFSLVHFAAAFITFLFIFKMIGYKIKSSFNILWHKWFKAKDKKVHLFWGVNEGSLLLAEDIYKENKTKETIIFVDVDVESNDASKKVTLSRITNTITIKDSEMSRLDDIEALVDHCYNGPMSVKVGDSDDRTMEERNRVQDIFKILHLRSIGKIVANSSEVNIYFLSDDEEQNIAGALGLQRDKCLYKKGDKVKMYVHARRGANNEIFDHYSQYADTEREQKVKIKLVDSAYLSVMALKQGEGALPVRCVDFDSKTAIVRSPFTSMVIGFGATGQEAFKFLYEFSAFIGPDKQKSPFKCYAIDAKMNEIGGLVGMKMPAISDQELELIQTGVNSDKFWAKVGDVIKELNYVVIALNNDDVGLALAVNMFKYAVMHRWGSGLPLKIMVRCYESCNVKRFEEVIHKLNNSIKSKEKKIEIQIFGKPRELYSCKNILSNEVLRQAKEFHRIYTINGPAPDPNEKPKEYEEFQYKIVNFSSDDWWEDSFGKLEDKNFGKLENKDKDAITVLMDEKRLSRYHAIYEINRKISQNISNAQHLRTKLILMGLADAGVDKLKQYLSVVDTREKKKVKYTCDADTSLVLENVAIVEHERWIAAHKLMGYTEGTENDIVHKHHSNICHWSELNEETQSYDYNVVDTTIRLAHGKVNKEETKS